MLIFKRFAKSSIGGVILRDVNFLTLLLMQRARWFMKFMIFLATLSLVLVALAPVIYLLAPQVTVAPEVAIGEEVPEDRAEVPEVTE